MKVLVDHQIFAAQKFGGISRYFSELANTSIYDMQNISPELLKKQQEPSTNIFARGTRFAKRHIGMPNSSSIDQLVDIRGELMSRDYDVFHPTYYDTYFLEQINKPFVITVYDLIHEIYSEYFDLSDSVIKNKKILCQKASRIIAISEQTKNDLIDLFKLPADKIVVTHLASDFDRIVPIKPKTNLADQRYILFVGNRGIYKNFYFFIQSIVELLKNDNSLSVVCTGHNFSPQENDYFNSFGIQKQIIHIHPESDNELAWLYINARIFAFPSLYEGFGLPLLEAYASNCPVVSSNGGSLPEVGGAGALYFEPKNMRQIQDAVFSALYDEVVRDTLVKKGKQQFAKFSWNKCRSETLAVYESAVR